MCSLHRPAGGAPGQHTKASPAVADRLEIPEAIAAGEPRGDVALSALPRPQRFVSVSLISELPLLPF